MLGSQSGPSAGAWLAAIPSDPTTTLSPHHMLLALRRRLRLHLPLTQAYCGRDPGTHGCGRRLDGYGDHMAACPRTGALARRGHLLEQVWTRLSREAVGAEGRVVPQQWLAATTAPGVSADDRRRLDFVVYGATPLGQALCADVTLVAPLNRDCVPLARAADVDGVAIAAARRRNAVRYPELLLPGPHELLVLACEIGGRWGSECHAFVRTLAALRAERAPPAVRATASAAWQRRWWGQLSCAVQRAVASTLVGGFWVAPPQPRDVELPLADVLDLADPPLPSRLPLISH